MSFFGISPTDIVNGARVITKAAAALSRGDKGAQSQYQRAETALSARLDAVEQLSFPLDPTSPAAEVYNGIAERERRFLTFLQRYRTALGPNRQDRPSSGLKQKLHYAFSGRSEVQLHVQNLQSMVDAAIMHTLRLQNEEAEKYFKLVTESMSMNTASILQRMDAVIQESPLATENLSSEQLADPVLSFLATNRDEIQASIVPLVEIAIQSVQSSKLAILQQLHDLSAQILPISSRLDAMDANWISGCAPQGPEQMNPGPASQRFKCSNCQDCSNIPLTHYRLAGSTIIDIYRRFQERIFSTTCVFVVVAICQSPIGNRIVCSLAALYQRDPMAFTALIMIVTTMVKYSAIIPAQVSLLSDQTLLLETALGEHLKIPSHYWASYEIFHGFLCTQFNNKPGAEHVKFGMYDIAPVGSMGQALDPKRWQFGVRNLVSRGIKAYMALVIQGYIATCPHCDKPLSLRINGTSPATKDYWFDGITLGNLSNSQVVPDATAMSANIRGKSFHRDQGGYDVSAYGQRSVLQRLADDYEQFRDIAYIVFYLE